VKRRERDEDTVKREGEKKKEGKKRKRKREPVANQYPFSTKCHPMAQNSL
jgi:hypothetical protein